MTYTCFTIKNMYYTYTPIIIRFEWYVEDAYIEFLKENNKADEAFLEFVINYCNG